MEPGRRPVHRRIRRTGGIRRLPNNGRSLVLDIAFRGRHLLFTAISTIGSRQAGRASAARPSARGVLVATPSAADPPTLTGFTSRPAPARGRRPAPRSRHASDALASLDRIGIPLLRHLREGSILTSRGPTMESPHVLSWNGTARMTCPPAVTTIPPRPGRLPRQALLPLDRPIDGRNAGS